MILDNPNIYLVLNLFIHTVPKFGQICNVGEISFESYRQVLKSGLRNNSHSEKHITPIEHALSKHYNIRLSKFHGIFTLDADGGDADIREILCLIAGVEVISLGPKGLENKEI